MQPGDRTTRLSRSEGANRRQGQRAQQVWRANTWTLVTKMCKAIQEDDQEAGQMGSTTHEVMQEDTLWSWSHWRTSPEAEQTSEPGREGWTSPKVRQEASGEHRTPLRSGRRLLA